jgi:hypothetical protein
MAEYDDIKTSSIALVGFVGLIVLVAIIFALQFFYYQAAEAQTRQKDLDQPVVELENAVHSQQAKLVGCRWIDQPKGVVAIPIDRAMELVVQEAAAGPRPRSGAAVAVPGPVAGPSPAAAERSGDAKP